MSISTLQMGKWAREGNTLTQGCIWQSWDLNPGSQLLSPSLAKKDTLV